MNGHPRPRAQVPAAGVWAPAITFFNPDTDEIDFESQAKYYRYLSQHLTGLVILGTNAETFLLTREERAALLRTARAAVGPDFPLMAGVGGHSTKQVREFVADAAAAGADYVLVLPCAYFGAAASPPGAVADFFGAVAAFSPLPVVIYNFPGVCNGVDLDSDAIAALARAHPNIVGCKLTCASVGKITRLAADFAPADFAVFGGQSDFLLGGLAVGSAGCIAAFANVFPKTIRRIYDLYVQGHRDEALRLHRIAAAAEALSKGGTANTKYAASLTSAKAAGIHGAEEQLRPRHPYPEPTEQRKTEIRARMTEMMDIEAGL